MDEDFKAELDWANERYDDLVAFTGSEAFGELSAEDQDLIVQQCSLLGHYKQIVQMRADKAGVDLSDPEPEADPEPEEE